MGALDILADGNLHLASELRQAGATATDLARAHAENLAFPIERGVWISAAGLDEWIGRRLGEAAVSLLNPGCVVCLFSATNWHGLADDDPPQIWIARDTTRRRHVTGDTVASVGWSGPLLTAGIEEHRIAGVTVRVTDPARTVVDVLRLRHRYGDEQSVRALHDYVRYGYDVKHLWDRAVEIGCLKAIEPFYRAAYEFRGSVPVIRPPGANISR